MPWPLAEARDPDRGAGAGAPIRDPMPHHPVDRDLGRPSAGAEGVASAGHNDRMHEEVLVSKIANALVEDVNVHVTVPVVSLFRSAWGGLWVGGRVTLTTRTVSFSANGMNRLMHSGTLDVSVPLAKVTDVKVLRGLFTNIVAITTLETVLKVRCYGAARFAEAILAARNRLA